MDCLHKGFRVDRATVIFANMDFSSRKYFLYVPCDPVSYRKCILMYDSLNALVFMIYIHEIMGNLQAVLHWKAVCWKFPNISFHVFRETTECVELTVMEFLLHD